MTLASEATADIFFTIDGSPVISGGVPTDAAQLYTGPIPISEPTTLKVAVFDRAGNVTLLTGAYKPPTRSGPGA